MTRHVGDRVLVKSALQFANIVEVEETETGTRYGVKFPDGEHVFYRYESELV